MIGWIGGGVAGGIVISAIALAQTPKPETPRPDGATQGDAAGKTREKKPVEMQPLVLPAAGVQDLGAQVQQELIGCRPLFLIELQFVRVACTPTVEQRRRIEQEAWRSLEKTVTESFRKAQARENKRQGEPSKDSDAWEAFQAGLPVVLKSHLSPEQWARYQDEIRKRAAHRKQTAVRSLLAQLDQVLYLTPDQRNKIGDSLVAHWIDTWNCQEAIDDNLAFPQIPDPVIVPFLTAVQKTVWKGLPKRETSLLDWEEIADHFMQYLPANDEIEPGKTGEPRPRR